MLENLECDQHDGCVVHYQALSLSSPCPVCKQVEKLEEEIEDLNEESDQHLKDWLEAKEKLEVYEKNK